MQLDTMTATAETAAPVEENRDMEVVEPQPVDTAAVTTVNLLDLMLIGADESKQAFGAWARENGDRCALGAMALGAKKLGLM